MINIKILDNFVSHDKNFFVNTNNITYTQIQSLDDISLNDIVIYTNNFQKNISKKSKINIALMMEGQEYCRHDYDYIANNNKKFDIVLTFDKKLLDKGENYKLNLYGTTWINYIYRKIYNKNKMCSFILSNKNITSGHKLRHVIVEKIRENKRK
jgi:hypothetical protein